MMVEIMNQINTLHCRRDELLMSIKTGAGWWAQFFRVDVDILPWPEAFRVHCLWNNLLTFGASGDRVMPSGNVRCSGELFSFKICCKTHPACQ